ncbi:MAG TPA: RNA methyltransferase [Vicinamibacterales bacterium]|nr:RNA methyltransferase [Vicinamibacterales bacterium]
MEHVTSRQNALVRRFAGISRDGRAGDEVLLDGSHLVEEAISSGVPLEVVAFGSEALQERLAPLAARCSSTGARVITVPDRLLGAMSPVQHAAGVVAIARLRQARLEDALTRAPQLILFLDGVQDPGNVGAIIRTAEGCGATAVITGPGTADPRGWKALRGSMGSAFRLPVASSDSLAGAVRAARAAGVRIFATAPRGGTPIGESNLAQPSGIILGGEGSGLGPETIGAADERLTITMRPPVESLNVAVAAALILYEASRQRTHVAV